MEFRYYLLKKLGHLRPTPWGRGGMGWTMNTDGPALLSERVKFSKSRFNSFYMGMGYVSKNWFLGCLSLG